MARSKTAAINKTTDNNRDLELQYQIRSRAYELFLERAGKDGSDVDDWLQAEAELAPSRGRMDRVSE